MALALPDWPYPAALVPRLVSGRAGLRPAWGGDVQRLNRGGSHYAVEVSLPVQTYTDAQEWSAIDSENETVTLQMVQPGLDTGAPGAPKVKGASQSGSSILLDGLTAAYPIRRRQWLSISTGGRLYLYRAKSEAVTATNGEVTVQLETMLRVSPADNDVVELASPRIEGFATVPEDAWAIDTAGQVALSFTIEERG